MSIKDSCEVENMLFSERFGYKKKILQSNSINTELRNSLWNIHKELFDEICPLRASENQAGSLNALLEFCWTDFFKNSIDDFRKSRYMSDQISDIRKSFYELEWHRVYSFLEFIATGLNGFSEEMLNNYKKDCNRILERENSAYRFVGNQVVPITSDIEIQEIETSLDLQDEPAKHIESALRLLKNKQYRECCHQAISAVEALARKITGEEKNTLGNLCKKLNLHLSFSEGLKKIYGYTSDADGIRHGVTDKSKEIKHEDANFMLIMCSAFCNFIRSKNKNAP